MLALQLLQPKLGAQQPHALRRLVVRASAGKGFGKAPQQPKKRQEVRGKLGGARTGQCARQCVLVVWRRRGCLWRRSKR